MAHAAFFILSLVVVGVTSSTIQKRLISGTTCQDTERLHHVRVVFQFPNQTTLTCGGTLIHKKWVITSSHCYGGRSGSLKVEIGGHPKTSVKKQLHIKSSKIFPYGNLPSEESIMLLKLPEAISKITPAKLPQKACIAPSEGEELRISGRGATTEGGHGSSNLMCLDVKVLQKEHCPDLAGSPFEKLVYIYCGGSVDDKAIKVCKGDSGSGLLKTENTETSRLFGLWKSEERSNVIYGVLISGQGECDDKIVFADLCAKPIKKWIRGHVHKRKKI